ncbi:Lysophospholipase L1 [Oribacterium sp. WCC10]|nr:Lysophospholipase L1 [Oribacterium sp. WCC10]
MIMKNMKILYLYGDSNTYGYNPLASCYEDGRLPEESRWPTILQKSLKESIQILEDGQNGRCLPGYEEEFKRFQKVLGRFDRLDYFAVMLGTNDLLNQSSHDSLKISNYMELLLQAVKAIHEECLCIVISPPKMGFPAGHPMNSYQEENVKLGALYSDVAEKYKARFVDAGKWDIDLFSDGIHLTEKGNRQFARHMVSALKKMKI